MTTTLPRCGSGVGMVDMGVAASRLIGPSNTMGATMLVRRRSATKVCVFQWTCGYPGAQALGTPEVRHAAMATHRADKPCDAETQPRGKLFHTRFDPQEVVVGTVTEWIRKAFSMAPRVPRRYSGRPAGSTNSG